MIRSQARLLAVLSVGLVGLVGVLYVGEGADPVADPRDSASVVPAFELDAVRSVEIVRSTDEVSDTVALVRDDDRWHLTLSANAAPGRVLAEETHVLDVVRAVEASEHGLPVPGEAADFGLDTPVAVVTLGLDDGSERIGID